MMNGAMDMEYLIKKYNSDEYIKLATQSLYTALQGNIELLKEIHVRNLSELTVSHKETSLVFYSTAHHGVFIKFTLGIESSTGERKGYYERITDLNDKFIDEFLVFR